MSKHRIVERTFTFELSMSMLIDEEEADKATEDALIAARDVISRGDGHEYGMTVEVKS